MRTIPLTLYLYDELPTDKAKEKARDWLDSCLQSCPDTSDFQKIIDLLRSESFPTLLEMAPRFADCPLTGFYADHDALEALHKAAVADPDASTDYLRRVAVEAVEKACEVDQEAMRERDSLEDMLRANEYEFTADGERYVCA